jgi:hypothetical protein
VVKGFRSGVDAGGYRNLVIPATHWAEPVTAIGDSAFMEKQLTGVVISNGVTTIGDSAFVNNQLSSVDIPNGVITIKNSAFANNRLGSVDIPDSVTTIGSRAFCDNRLSLIIIGKGVTTIMDNAFTRSLNGDAIISIPGNVTFVPVATREDTYNRAANHEETIWHNRYGFMEAYDRNGKKAGKYVNKWPKWRYSPEEVEVTRASIRSQAADASADAEAMMQRILSK